MIASAQGARCLRGAVNLLEERYKSFDITRPIASSIPIDTPLMRPAIALTQSFYQRMNTTFTARVRRGLGRLAQLVLLPAVLAYGLAAPSAKASVAAPPVIYIQAIDPVLAGLNGAPVFTWRTDGRPLQFGGGVDRTHTGFPPVDVYFGVMIPGGRLFTWTPGTGSEPNLREGLFPAGQGITAIQISTRDLLGASPQRPFSSADPLGVYSIFLFLTSPGADPRDARGWYGASMSPLVITN
ncbi:hypothetical protein [Caenimonas aquaedulcis]|uniref:Uncharacterized protein n=1 Tax=Caenimonas aquaedulcis TaxID=2793270 RepID=A0A931H8E3_9BURK|nr:hypothetical protein [Caenimonas aquaedulcis]MBG9390614.1 hypothetical protein [Caenimonas aquaedulcis]